MSKGAPFPTFENEPAIPHLLIRMWIQPVVGFFLSRHLLALNRVIVLGLFWS